MFSKDTIQKTKILTSSVSSSYTLLSSSYSLVSSSTSIVPPEPEPEGRSSNFDVVCAKGCFKSAKFLSSCSSCALCNPRSRSSSSWETKTCRATATSSDTLMVGLELRLSVRTSFAGCEVNEILLLRDLLWCVSVGV